MFRTKQILIAASVLLGGTSGFASDVLQEARVAANALRSSGGRISVPFRDAYLLNLDLDARRPTSGKHFRSSYDELLTIGDASVTLTRQEGSEWSVRSVYHGASEVLAIQKGPVGGQFLIVDRESLQLVDFSSPKAVRLGSFAIDNGAATSGSPLIERFADSVYVVDAGLPGFRVVSIADPADFREVTRFSTAAAPTEIAVRDGHVYLLVQGEVVVVSVGDLHAPVVAEARTWRGAEVVTKLAFDEYGRCYFADGATLTILSRDPESPTFLNVTATVHMPARIDDIVIQNGQAFVVDPTGGLEVVTIADDATATIMP